MATNTKTEPEYMELRKDSDATKEKEKESEVHIYELDVPNVPKSTKSKSTAKELTKTAQGTALEYHYVRNNDQRSSQMHVSTLVATIEKRGVQSRLKGESENNKKNRRFTAQRRRRPSLKCVAIVFLFILTIINTILATAALAIAGILYTQAPRGMNSTQLGVSDFLNS